MSSCGADLLPAGSWVVAVLVFCSVTARSSDDSLKVKTKSIWVTLDRAHERRFRMERRGGTVGYTHSQNRPQNLSLIWKKVSPRPVSICLIFLSILLYYLKCYLKKWIYSPIFYVYQIKSINPCIKYWPIRMIDILITISEKH